MHFFFAFHSSAVSRNQTAPFTPSTLRLGSSLAKYPSSSLLTRTLHKKPNTIQPSSLNFITRCAFFQCLHLFCLFVRVYQESSLPFAPSSTVSKLLASAHDAVPKTPSHCYALVASAPTSDPAICTHLWGLPWPGIPGCVTETAEIYFS